VIVGHEEKTSGSQADASKSSSSGKRNVLSSRDRRLSCDEFIVVVGHREKATTSRADAGKSSSGGRRTVKSGERTDPGRHQQQTCNGPVTGQRRSDAEEHNTASGEQPQTGAAGRHGRDQVHAVSSRHGSETLDAESNSYYTQRVAPVLDKMTRSVHGETSSRGTIILVLEI